MMSNLNSSFSLTSTILETATNKGVSTSRIPEPFVTTTILTPTDPEDSASRSLPIITLCIVLPVIAIAVIVTVILRMRVRKLHSETDTIHRQHEADRFQDYSILTDDDLHNGADENDMFGLPWDFQQPLSSLKDQTDINDTGVSIGYRTFSNQYGPESKLDLYCSVHTYFKVLASELNIKKNQMLVSPAAELTLSSKTRLHGQVIIELPLCKFETFSSLGVHWISTPLKSFATVKDIPYEEDPTWSSLDCFYTRVDSRTVRVYTKHFSLFFCTCCKSDVRFELSTQICARVGVIDGYPTLQIKLFFRGLQNRLKKQKEKEHEFDVKKGFSVIEGGEIHLLKKQNSKKKSGFLKCRLSTLMEERCPKWEHRTRGENQCPIYQPEQVVDVAELIKCWHKDHELCYCINWYLRCEKRYCHRLPIIIDVENTRDLTKSDQTLQTTFTMEVDISTELNRLQDPIRNFIDNFGLENMGRLHDVLAIDSGSKPERASSEYRDFRDRCKLLTNKLAAQGFERCRGSVEDEREYWYDTLSVVWTDPIFSQRLSNAMATVGGESCDHGILGLISDESEQKKQSLARHELERSYDCPETTDTGSSYAKVDSHIRYTEPTYLSLNDDVIDSVRTGRPQRQPRRQNNGVTENNTYRLAQTFTSQNVHYEGAKPIICSELRDREEHVLIDRPSPIGASNDPDETKRKEIVDTDETNTKWVVSVGVTQPDTLEEYSDQWV